MYICNDCRSIFTHPLMVQNGFYHEHGCETWDEPACPVCSSDNIDQAVPCANPTDNINAMRSGDTLCSSCRAALKDKVLAFTASLTEPELQQLDEWLDGNSIRDCKFWEVTNDRNL